MHGSGPDRERVAEAGPSVVDPEPEAGVEGHAREETLLVRGGGREEEGDTHGSVETTAF